MRRRSYLLVLGLLLAGVLLWILRPWGRITRGPSVDVAAASSLSDVLEDLLPRCEGENAGRATLSTGGSQTIARQVVRGQPADIVFLAHDRWMDYLQERGLLRAETRVRLLSSHLVLVSPRRAPIPVGGWKELEDFDRPLALGNPRAVPAGIYTRQALEAMGVWEQLEPRVVSFPHVRAVVSAVQSGNVPLGIVYRSDAHQFQDTIRVADTIPRRFTPAIGYPIALTVRHGEAARRCYETLISASAREVYRQYGFSTPTS